MTSHASHLNSAPGEVFEFKVVDKYLMFRTYSDNYIPIPVREYRSVETNVPHHSWYTAGMRRPGHGVHSDIIAWSVTYIKNPYFLKIP